MTHFETTILRQSGVTLDSDLADTATARANIFDMTEATEAAVLRPKDFGGFPHDLRAALAARVARLAGDEDLALHFATDAEDRIALADPSTTDAELAGVLAFVDKVANQTRDITADDILALQAAGVSDADIVRLCELVAFLAYQTRVIAGLRLMQGVAP
ncbi:MAG: hypothetical protein HKN18_04300 [Silicimonas sp.]|nr:hypothetical protein [Silicimonas sp.]